MSNGEKDATGLGQGLYGKGFAIDPKPKAEGQYSAEGLLEDGLKTLSERGQQYDPKGKAERSMEKIVAAFQIITGKQLTEAEGWMFMAVLKQVRSFQRPGFHADSAQDFVCYSALYGEAKAKEGDREGRVLVRPEHLDERRGTCGCEVKEVVKPTIMNSVQAQREFEKIHKGPPGYIAQQVSEEARNELRSKAFILYLQAAKSMQIRCASSWHDMHPAEQKAWLGQAMGMEPADNKLPIIDPTTRIKDPKTGLDLPV